jgi:hypothetical protein
MRILIAEPGYSTKIKEPLDENGRHKRYHHVYIYEATLWKWFVSRAYHWYDMRIPIRIPGWGRFISIYKKLTGAENRAFMPCLKEDGTPDPDFPGPRWRDKLVGWEYEQDLRCYHLSLMGRKDVKSLCLDLTDEQYLKIRPREMKKLDKQEEARVRLRDSSGPAA